MKIIKEQVETKEENKPEEVDKELEKAKEEAEKMIDPKEAADREPVLGAEDQPVPEKVEAPKAILEESLFEDYDENSIQGAIKVINRYYKGDLKAFLESVAFNCPVFNDPDTGKDFIISFAEFLSDFEFDESLKEGKETLYVIKDRNGNQLSSPNADDDELWDRVEDMEALGKTGLKVVVYTEESLNESDEEIDYSYVDDQVFNGIDDIFYNVEQHYGTAGDMLPEDHVELEDIEDRLKRLIKKIIYVNSKTPSGEDDFDESLKESIFSHYDDGLVTLNQNLVQVKPCFLNKREAEKLANRVIALSKAIKEALDSDVADEEDLYDKAREFFKNTLNMDLPKDIFNIILNHNNIPNKMEMECIDTELNEGDYGNKGNDEWQALNDKKTKADKEEEDTLWDRVYSELATELPHKISAPKGSRYERIFIDNNNGGIGVYVEKESDLDFAKKVADYFGLKFKSYKVPNNADTLTAVAGVVIVPEELWDETSEETKERLAKKD